MRRTVTRSPRRRHTATPRAPRAPRPATRHESGAVGAAAGTAATPRPHRLATRTRDELRGARRQSPDAERPDRPLRQRALEGPHDVARELDAKRPLGRRLLPSPPCGEADATYGAP